MAKQIQDNLSKNPKSNTPTEPSTPQPSKGTTSPSNNSPTQRINLAVDLTKTPQPAIRAPVPLISQLNQDQSFSSSSSSSSPSSSPSPSQSPSNSPSPVGSRSTSQDTSPPQPAKNLVKTPVMASVSLLGSALIGDDHYADCESLVPDSERTGYWDDGMDDSAPAPSQVIRLFQATSKREFNQ